MNPTAERVLTVLYQKAKINGLTTCLTCGATGKHGTDRSHFCQDFMVRKDLLAALLSDRDLVDEKTAKALSIILEL